MILRIAIVLLLLVSGYALWIVALNLPGEDGSPSVPRREASAPALVPVTKRAEVADPLPPSGVSVIPVLGVHFEQLVDTFDDARSEGRVHDAIDIMAPYGTSVIAAAAGTVEKLFESKRGGTTVYIRRSGGQWVDYYAHLDSYVPGLAEGQKISQGQMIGRVGSTGDASPESPHLHYAIHSMAPGEGWWQGRAVNPYPLLREGD